MPAILKAPSDTPIVLLNGARQTGKSTSGRYITLDEVQRDPKLFLAIKAAVDRQRLPSSFLLAGLTNPLLLPKLLESLAGRMEMLTLWPFSQGELERRPEDFIDRIFASKLPQFSISDLGRDELIKRVLTGGYPEIVGKVSARRRSAWFYSYITTIGQHEVRDLANIEHLAMMPVCDHNFLLGAERCRRWSFFAILLHPSTNTPRPWTLTFPDRKASCKTGISSSCVKRYRSLASCFEYISYVRQCVHLTFLHFLIMMSQES